jgi:hypothetical protein
MKKTLLLVFGYLWAFSAAAQNIDRAEYFIDSDPGLGNGTAITVSVPAPDVTLNFGVDLGSVSSGFHTLYVRGRDDNGTWSIGHAHAFFKTYGSAPALENIVAMEYFVDSDPGLGSGTPVVVSPQGTDIQETFTVNIDALSSGFHTLYVRAQDNKGRWSSLNAHAFFKTYSAPGALQNIVQLEYFIDNDPGFGGGTNLPITPSTDVTKNFVVDLGPFASGFHTLYIRGKDAAGRWNALYAHAFFKTYPAPSPLNEVTTVEYFIDNDPGLGLATPIVISSGTDVTQNFVVDLDNVTSGFHTLYVRSQDTTGVWSVMHAHAFFKTYPSAAAAPSITGIDYYFYKSGVSTPILSYDAFTPGPDVVVNFAPDLSSLDKDSTYQILVFGRDSLGIRSLAAIDTFVVPDIPPAAPKNLIALSGNGEVTLTWSPNIEGDFHGYYLYQSTSPNPTTLTDSVLIITDTTKTIAGLTNGTTYYFRLTARDTAGNESAYSNEVASTPGDVTAPSAPQLLTAVNGNGQVTLTWRKNSEPDILRYRVYSATTPGAAVQVDSTAAADTTLLIAGLSNGTAYYFRVSALDNALNLSGYSNELSATPSAVNINPVVTLAYLDINVIVDTPDTTLDSIAYHFYDPDDATLAFTTTSLTPTVVTSSIVDGRLVLSLLQTGTADIVVTATDDSGAVAADTFAVNVLPGNQRPMATDDAVSTPMNSAVTIHVLNNDNDPDDDPLTVTFVGTAGDGSPAIDTGDTTITYIPVSGFTGTDQFIYITSDGEEFDTATVTVTVTALLNISASVLQNPALSRYADVFVLADTALQGAPVVRLIFSSDSSSIAMSAVTPRVYKGPLTFAQSGSYTIRSTATGVTGASRTDIRGFTVGLARPGTELVLASAASDALLRVRPGTVDAETYFVMQSNDGVISVGPVREFDRPVELSVHIDPLKFPDASRVFIYQKSGEAWTALRTQVYTREQIAKVRVQRLGEFKIAVDPSFTGTNIVPSDFALRSNYPNPFNPSTTIAFDMADDGVTELAIYNVLGQKVRTLVSGYQLAGSYRILWDSRNDAGRAVASGVYLYRLKSGSFVKTNKMMLIK